MEYTAPVKLDRRYWKIYVEIALLSLLCITQYFGISIANLALTCGVLGIHFLMDDMQTCTIGLFCALPTFNFLNMRVGSISFYYLMVFIFWLRYLQYHNWKISKTKFMVLFALLVIRITSGEVKETLTWFVLISVLVLTFGEDFFDRNIYHIVLFTTIVFLLSSLVGYFMLKAGRSIYTGGQVWTGKVKSIRFAGVIGDPVFFSQCCSLLAACHLTFACHNKRHLLWGVLFAGCCLLLCLESYAKTGMLLIALCAVASVVWFIWDRLQSKRTAVLSILLMFAGVVGAALLVNYILTNTDNLIIQNYVTRLSQDDLLTGRTEIWAHYLSMLGNSWRSLFFALPASDFSRYFAIGNGGYFNDPHNILIESACLFGIIPTLCMFMLVFVLMYRCFISRKGILWQMPICVMLASGFTLHGHLEFHYYTLVAIAFSFLSSNSPKQPGNYLH
jgi:O-antigen ligase